MTCKETEKRIPAFLADELDTEELEEVLSHVDGCASCREELTIQFLVSTGIKRLEEGDTFHLGRELAGVLSERRGSIRRVRRQSVCSTKATSSLRAKEYIELKDGFEVPAGAQIYLEAGAYN